MARPVSGTLEPGAPALPQVNGRPTIAMDVTQHQVLVVDDDAKTANLIRLYLEREGFQVMLAYDGREALEAARQRRPDLIVLDLMLPRVDGLDITRILRAESDVPIIMLTARSTEDDKLLGLDLGADDYITKPFSPREVVARVRTVLRRLGREKENRAAPIRIGSLAVDLAGYLVTVDEQPVSLTPKEFSLLSVLIQEPDRAFSREELLERAFGFDYEGLDRTIDVHIRNLRKKIEADPARPIFIATVYGVGYKFDRQLAQQLADAEST